MATTGNTNNQTKQFGGNGAISLKSVRDFFGGNSNNIKFSKYYRKTNVDISTSQFGKESTGYFVPDSTENSTVKSSGSNHSFGDFRGENDNGVLKTYLVTQTGSNDRYSLHSGSGAGSTWNGNLARNVPKTGRISGRCFTNVQSNGSSTGNFAHSTGSALKFSATAYNLEIDIDSGQNRATFPNSVNNSNNGPRGVFSTGGTGGTQSSPNGKAGGTAMYVAQGSNRSKTSAIININNGNGHIFGGGGGGVSGRNGNAGNRRNCTFYSSKTVNIYSGGSGLNIRALGSYANNSGSCGGQNIAGVSGSWYHSSPSGSDNRSRCRSEHGGNRSRGASNCFAQINKTCFYSHNFKGNASAAGNGGNGGAGQGSNNLGVFAGHNNGNVGTCSNCNAVSGYGVVSGNVFNCGNNGTAGSIGGLHGQNGQASLNRSSGSAGSKGHAVYSNTKAQVKLSSTKMARGTNSNVTT
tara:strand:+ start:5316 stop:6710 length:1395 start_codon:yes stop_codon:yes gene_type:complete